MPPLPLALYGLVLLMTGCAYVLLSRAPIACDGADSVLGRAVGKDRKGIASQILYALALYVLVALIWFVPNRRIESVLPQ